MRRKITLFNRMLQLLIENVIPNILLSAKDLGADYIHITIPAECSLPFFNHINIQFPYNQNELISTTDNGVQKFYVILNINKNGELSIADNVLPAQNGINTLRNKIVISDDIIKFFNSTLFENNLLFMISKELTNRARSLEVDHKIVLDLLAEMNKIKPKITRNVLMEKK